MSELSWDTRGRLKESKNSGKVGEYHEQRRRSMKWHGMCGGTRSSSVLLGSSVSSGGVAGDDDRNYQSQKPLNAMTLAFVI